MKVVSSCQLSVAGWFSLLNHPFCSLFLTSYFFILFTPVCAQTDIPIGTWRLHLSYNTIKSIAIAGDKVYGTAESGILVFNREDNSLSSYNTLNGLSSTGISCIAYDDDNQLLLIAYTDGNLDILKNNEVTNFNRLKTSSTVTGSKKINHISLRNNFAYLSTDYGVVVFDLISLELKETWRDLGSAGGTLPVYESTFANDSIFLATGKGVLAGDIKKNLLDFRNWKRFDTGALAVPIQNVTVFNSKIYVSINSTGIFRYENGVWTKENFLQNETYNFLSASKDHLLIGLSAALWRMTTNATLTPVLSDKIISPLAALEDNQQKLWIGDQQNGLVSDLAGSFNSYLPNGPTITSPFRLKFNNRILYALAGGFSAAGVPLQNSDDLNYFENGIWNFLPESFKDLTDIDFSNSSTYLSSFGEGLKKTDATGNTTVIDNTNSPLSNVNPPNKSVYITAMESSRDGLWVANYGAVQPLHLLQQDNSWQSFSISLAQARYPTDIAVDTNGKVWMILNPLQGGGLMVFDRNNNTSLFRSDVAGNGALPNRFVYAIDVDRDGNVWVGTQEGVAYFFSDEEDAVKPIFDNRFLLRDEKITAIKTDGGNRKWIGTERGVWLFNSTGEELVYNFTAENSPLLSNNIRDIEVNGENGEVFFATDKGIISYRADASSGDISFKNIKIFPNPVTADFSGMVGITGLSTDSIVKITDVSGKLIWQTQANGGTATWNVRDYNGRRASTGIYLVFAATPDGKDSVVGKIAVVN